MNKASKITGRVRINNTDSTQTKAAALLEAQKIAFNKLMEEMPLYKCIAIEAREESHTFEYNDELEFIYTLKIYPVVDATPQVDSAKPKKNKWLLEFAAGLIAGLLFMMLVYILLILIKYSL
jgi:hypothetical protein